MIDPNSITDFGRSQAELEEFLLFAISVAGKNAASQSVTFQRFLEIAGIDVVHGERTPIEMIRILRGAGKLETCLRDARMGKYTLLARAYSELADAMKEGLDLGSCTPDLLEAIHGIGPKTSRFFILHSRPEAHYAVLDVHILKYMREYLGVKAPKHTPQSQKEYSVLERIFLAHASETNLPPADLDLYIWSMYSSGKSTEMRLVTA